MSYLSWVGKVILQNKDDSTATTLVLLSGVTVAGSDVQPCQCVCMCLKNTQHDAEQFLLQKPIS